VIRVEERDRLPEPVALFFGQVGQKSKEVGLVLEATARHLLLDAEVGRALEEKQDFGHDRGQTPWRRRNAIPQREADARPARQNPVVAGAVAELDIEAVLRRRFETSGSGGAVVAKAGCDVVG